VIKCKYAIFRPSATPSPQVPLGARSVGHHTVAPLWQDNIFEVNHVVFFWGIGGSGQVVFENVPHKLSPGHIAVYMPGMVQNIHALDNQWEYCWWTMDGPEASQLTRGFGFDGGIYQAGPAPIAIIELLGSIISEPGRNNEIRASMLAYRLLSHAASLSVPVGGERYDEALVHSAIELITECWHDPAFGVDVLASTLKIHRSTLSRRFRRVTGSTIIDYITATRMRNAMSLLRESAIPVAEVAARCGYEDANYFSRLMKKRLGVSPTQFRQKSG